MKKIIVPLICLLTIVITAIYHEKLVDFATKFFTNKQE